MLSLASSSAPFPSFFFPVSVLRLPPPAAVGLTGSFRKTVAGLRMCATPAPMVVAADVRALSPVFVAVHLSLLPTFTQYPPRSASLSLRWQGPAIEPAKQTPACFVLWTENFGLWDWPPAPHNAFIYPLRLWPAVSLPMKEKLAALEQWGADATDMTFLWQHWRSAAQPAAPIEPENVPELAFLRQPFSVRVPPPSLPRGSGSHSAHDGALLGALLATLCPAFL